MRARLSRVAGAGLGYVLTLLGFAGLSAFAFPQDLVATEVASGLDQPVLATAPFRDADRLFIGEQSGAIRVLKGGVLLAEPFLDVSTLVSTGSERGLLGLAFHPEYSLNGRFFVSVTDLGGDTSVLEFRASVGDPDRANPTPVQVIYSHPQPYDNHNGGCLAFAADGRLLLALGDGGGTFDPQGNAQNLSNGLGSILRFDIDGPAPFIPPDNPFVGHGGEEAVFAHGLRNPWRFSVDPFTGDVWIGDVGQYEREEIDVLPGGSPGGENFGWRCLEGTACTGQTGCQCASGALTPPVFEIAHGQGDCAITGGHVYRGARIPELYGRYVFGDFCARKIRSLAWDGAVASDLRDHSEELDPPGPARFITVSSFGEDGAGELYFCDYASGVVYRIDPECSATPYCATLPNSTGFGGLIGGLGVPNLSGGTFGLQAWGVPAGAPGLFFYGLGAIQEPAADGFLCVASGGVGVFRLAPVIVGSNGRVEVTLDVAGGPLTSGPGALQPWTSTYFQFWHRDVAGPMGTGSNFTRGLRVSFCP